MACSNKGRTITPVVRTALEKWYGKDRAAQAQLQRHLKFVNMVHNQMMKI